MVAIKYFGMPSCCMNCEMRIDGLSAGYYCAITEEELNDNSTLEHRHPNCPLVEIEEQKIGKWISDGHGHIVCTACNEVNVSLWKSKYCPCCGAEMRGSEDEHTNC